MVSGRDIDTSADRVRTPSPAPRSSGAGHDWRGGVEFQAYLRDAEPRDRPVAKAPSRAKREEKEREGGDLSALFGPTTLSSHAATKESDGAAISGLAPAGQAAQAPEISVPVPTAGGAAADINALSAAMDRAWAAAMGDKGKALTVFMQQASVIGLDVRRGADGSLSLILAARPDATPEVTRALEALRRRLEARGLSLAELRLAMGDEGLEPKVPGILE